ncbi:MAG TPA: S8 family serine peptidase [Thermoanaerobaculia bacterium]
MKKLLAVLITLCAALPLLAQSKTRYLISMRRPAAVSTLRLVRDAAQAVAHDVRTFSNVDYVAADLTDAEAADLRRSSEVRFIAPVIERSIFAVEGAPVARHHIDTQSIHTKTQDVPYGIDLVHARDVWPFTRGGNSSINVAIVDTGIDYTHPDLKDRYQGGFNAFTKTNDPKDDHGHGTHVAGTIGATDNSFGVVGVAPEVRIWSAKVLMANGSGTDESVMAGIDWVINKKNEIGGNWIINLSLGADMPSDPERDIFARAIAEGILVVAAAGNNGTRGLEYPAAYDRVVAVSAIDSDSKLAGFSSFGAGTVFAGPGVDVLSTFRTGVITNAEIDANATPLDSALPINGSALGDVTADTVYCGIGKPEQFPADARGKIALITRGTLYFRDKTRNAIAAGVVGVVIVPPLEDGSRSSWTLLIDPADSDTTWPVVVSASTTQGKNLVDNAGKMPITITVAPDDYALLSGTSMATPHVVGVAALVWSLAPNATAEQIRLAMKLSAFDLGAAGYDEDFGYGRVDALASAKYVAPGIFGLPPTPPPVPTRRRPSSH